MFTIFLIVASFAVIKVLMQIINERRCLDDSSIRLFMLNRLNEKERKKITAHLVICEQCRDKFHNFEFGKSSKEQE